jgi:uncharacterized coiled-coil protein SlyX
MAHRNPIADRVSKVARPMRSTGRGVVTARGGRAVGASTQVGERVKTAHDIYQGIPDSRANPEQALLALTQTVETLTRNKGDPDGSAVTLGDLEALTRAYDARYVPAEGTEDATIQGLNSSIASLEQATQSLAGHTRNFLNPHRVQHRQLSDNANSNAHPQSAIGGRAGATNLQTDQEKQDNAVQALETDLDALELVVAGLDTTALTARVSALETDIATVKTDVAGLKTTVTNLQTTVAALDTRITALENAP